MPKKGNYENPPTYRTKSQAIRHGEIQYGRDSKGRKRYRIWKTKKGWSVSRKKHARRR